MAVGLLALSVGRAWPSQKHRLVLISVSGKKSQALTGAGKIGTIEEKISDVIGNVTHSAAFQPSMVPPAPFGAMFMHSISLARTILNFPLRLGLASGYLIHPFFLQFLFLPEERHGPLISLQNLFSFEKGKFCFIVLWWYDWYHSVQNGRRGACRKWMIKVDVRKEFISP
jgi:hypothetical protein